MPDVASLSVGLLILAALTLSPLLNAGIANKSSMLGLINANVDDAAHIGMLNDRIQFNRGILYHSDAASNVRYASEITTYPAGWHSSNAAIIMSVDSKIKTGVQTIEAYVITKVFWFLLLVIFFVRSVFSLYNTLSCQKKYKKPIVLWLTFASLFFSYFFLVDTFREGFYSFLPQLISISVLIMILLKNYGREKDNRISFSNYLLVLTFLCISGSLSWIFVLPAFVLTVVLVLFDYAKVNGRILFIKNTWHSIIDFLPLYIVLILACLIQFYISTMPSQGAIPFLEAISLRGPIVNFKDIFYYFIFAGFALCLYLFNTRSYLQFKSILNLACSTVLFAGGVYLLQIFYIDHNEYYYYKTLNTFLIVALPIAIVGYGFAIDKFILRGESKIIALSVSIVMSALLVQFIGLNQLSTPSDISAVSYIKGSRYSNTTTNEVTWNLLKDRLTQNDYLNKNYVFIYEPGSRMDQAYTNTMILQSNKPASSCFTGSLYSFVSPVANAEDILTTVNRLCRDGHTVTIVTDIAHKSTLVDAVRNKNMQDIVTVQSYDDIIHR